MLGHEPPAEFMDADETENEDEVDQLDSDSEAEEDTQDPSDSSGSRIPGQTVLPITRLENIIQSGVTGHLPMSKEGQFLVSVATEEFIKRMVQAGQRQAHTDRRNMVNYRDMASTTQQYQEFMFLSDTIPSPLSLSDALQRREAKEKELLEEDPAMSTSLSVPNTSKGKGRSRLPNGKEKPNGSASSSRRDSRSRDTKGRWSYGHPAEGRAGSNEEGWTSCTWSEERAPFGPPLAGAPHRIPSQNGVTPGRLSPIEIRSDQFVPVRPHMIVPRDERPGPELVSSSHHPPHPPSTFLIANDSEIWPGSYTGPASGFLQNSRRTFGRVSPNPGRTIYSHHHPNESGSFP